jgi:hypothetical protein
MGINIGAGPVDDIRIGTAEVDKVYRGDTQIWSADTGPAVIVDQLNYTPTNTGAGILSYTFDLTTLTRQAGDVAVLLISSGGLTTGNQVNTALDSEAVAWDRLSTEDATPNLVVTAVYTTVFGETLPNSVTTSIANAQNGTYEAMRASIYIIGNAARPVMADMTADSGTNSPAFARSVVDTDVLLGLSGSYAFSLFEYDGAPLPLTAFTTTGGITAGIQWITAASAQGAGETGVVPADNWSFTANADSTKSYSLIVSKKT